MINSCILQTYKKIMSISSGECNWNIPFLEKELILAIPGAKAI
jgi:hypothetical protein